MATRFYGLNRGEPQTSVSESSSTTSKKIELAVDLSSSLTALDVYQALEIIQNYILTNNKWPPA